MTTNQQKSRDWKQWVLVGVVAIMLATMGMYLASMDEGEPETVVDRAETTNL